MVVSSGQTPPLTPIRSVHDTYFGQDVTDDYRWLEDLSSPEVQTWMKDQNTYARAFLERLPDRMALINRVEELDHDAVQVSVCAVERGLIST